MASTSVDAETKGFGTVLAKEKIKTHQSMDYTAIAASVSAMENWVPSRVEEVRLCLHRLLLWAVY